jgi:adenylate kinase
MQCSTGNLCRQHIAKSTPLGQQIAFIIKSGKLISDSLIIDMVDEWLTEQQKKYSPVILDGFPRTIGQAQAFDDLLQKSFLSLCRVIVVEILLPDDVVVQRLMQRIICENRECQAIYAQHDSFLAPKQEGICDKCSYSLVRRIDDEEDTVRERLQAYHHHARELMSYYRDHKTAILELKANKPLELVFNTFKNLIGLESA